MLQFILLMTEAIVAFSSNTFLSRNLKYNDRLDLHGLLQFTAGILIGVAFWSVYSHKNNNNYSHFVSSHASWGLTVCLMIVGTTVGGVAAKYNAVLRKIIKPAYLKIVHSLFGVTTYVLAVYTLCLGINTDWFRSQCYAQLIDILTYAAASVAFLALIKPIISIAGKIRNSTKIK